MRKSPAPAVHSLWNHPSYEVRVRGTTSPITYLWGSAGVTKDINFEKPLVLHLRNDPFGEDITFGTQVAAGTQTTIGTLRAGECISLPVQGISGIFATCVGESTVACLLKE